MKKILVLFFLIMFGYNAMSDTPDPFFFLEKDGRLLSYSKKNGYKLYWISQSEIKDTVMLKQVLWRYGWHKYLDNLQDGETRFKHNKKGNIYCPLILGFKDYVYDKNGEPTKCHLVRKRVMKG